MCVNDELEMAGEEEVQRPITSETSSHVFPPPLSPLESICENTVTMESKQGQLPVLHSGEWSDVGGREQMEDTHLCIADLGKMFGHRSMGDCLVSLYGVFDGHDGKDAAQFVRDNLPKVIVKDAGFPLELEKVITRSYMEIDAQFAQRCSAHSSLSSGTTAITALIFGRSLLVANAGDCRAVLSRFGVAIDMSKDHRTSCVAERKRIESLGGYIIEDYLNGQLAVTRALGDWHLKGMKKHGQPGGPLTAEPELKVMSLTKDDEFLIIGSDGIWEAFTSHNAVDFVRRQLQKHNDAKMCCRELVDEAKRRGADDNLTVIVVCFKLDPPVAIPVVRSRVRRCISAEGLNSLRSLLEHQNSALE